MTTIRERAAGCPSDWHAHYEDFAVTDCRALLALVDELVKALRADHLDRHGGGESDLGEPGERPPHFTIDRDALPLRVGPDWTDR